ncbi:MAG: GH32 C-terminal domain-containing protein, partial [Acidobacteriota bacterium]
LLEIRMSVSGSPRKPFGLSVREGEQEETRVGVQPEGPFLFLDRSESGDAGFYSGFGRRFEAPLWQSVDGGLDLHMFVDSSSVEVFADDGTAVITAQIFPSRESTGVSLFGEGDDLVVDRLEIWKLRSVWRETARD